MNSLSHDRLSRFGWLSFDFANTIFSMNIVTMYFALYLIDDLGCPDIYYSFAYSFSMVFVALIMPYYGHYSDLKQNKKTLLINFTILSVIFTAILGVSARLAGSVHIQIITALICFGAANFFYEGGIAFYNALLRSVSSKENIGATSGLGVGLGYIGAIFGLIIVYPFVKGYMPGFPAGRASAFLPTAVLFLLCSIPAFLLIREKTFEQLDSERLRVTQNFNKLWQNLKLARENKGAFRFLISNYFFEDAVVTAIMFMALYAEKVVGCTDRVKIELFILATVAAAAGSVISGRISDKFGPKQTLTVVVLGWIVILLTICVITYKPVFWIAACVVGMLLGSAWTVARPLLNSLVPDQKLGLFYGLYALSGRTAAILGPIIWGIIVTTLKADNPFVAWVINSLGTAGIQIDPTTLQTIQYRFAVAALAVLMAIGLFLFREVPDRHNVERSEHLYSH